MLQIINMHTDVRTGLTLCISLSPAHLNPKKHIFSVTIAPCDAQRTLTHTPRQCKKCITCVSGPTRKIEDGADEETEPENREERISQKAESSSDQTSTQSSLSNDKVNDI